MSIASLERAIVYGAREVLCNPKLRLKDLLEWSTSPCQNYAPDEIMVRVPDPGAYAVFPKACDRRGPRKP